MGNTKQSPTMVQGIVAILTHSADHFGIADNQAESVIKPWMEKLAA